MSERLGWMGLGDLGSPMAANLLESGYDLTVYNRSRNKAEPLVERGARIADEPHRVAEKGGTVVSILWNSDVTESLNTPEFLACLEGGIHVGMCTGSPDAAKRLAKLHAEHGSTYVEAPVFGRPEAAKARQLSIPFAGPANAKERVKPLLTKLGGHTLFDTGEQYGVPTIIKQLGNFLIISMAGSLNEGLAIVNSAGADPMVAVNMLSESVFTMPLFRSYGSAIAETKDAFPSSKIPAKDLGLFNQLATQYEQVNPIMQTLLRLTIN